MSNLAGVARHTLDVAGHGLPGWDLAVLCPPGDLPLELRTRGARVIEAPFGPGHGLVSSVRSLRRAAAATGATVLHAHLAYADVAAALGTFRRDVRLVTTEHGIAGDDAVYHRSSREARAMGAVHRARFRQVDAAIAVSAATARAMRTKWGVSAPIHVVPNGVDQVVPGPARPGLRVLSLARLAPEKRLPELLTAFAALARAHQEATLTIAGIGELEPTLRAQVRELGLADRVDFPGFVDAGKAMADADVVAMLSVWENCSYSLLDAAAAGRGVVASPVGGNPELLPGRCLVDPTRPAEVAQVIAEQGLDPAARPHLVGWPTVADMCDRIAEVYGEAA